MSQLSENCEWVGEKAAFWAKEVLGIEGDSALDLRSRVIEFYEALIQENSVQNLTRLTEPKDFIEGHLLDVLHLEKTGYLARDSRPFDLGSGGGVPGLLHAHIFRKNWILCDSEKLKADFLGRFCSGYSLNECEIVNTRAEQWLNTHRADQIVARAVGTVTKIYTWLEKCSTWNQLILLKGPNWGEEWKEFTQSRFRNKLTITNEYSYSIGEEQKVRKIIHLTKK
jgi:16S rRNA (guanine(527)-N(7))-methyltransferase RsmG